MRVATVCRRVCHINGLISESVVDGSFFIFEFIYLFGWSVISNTLLLWKKKGYPYTASGWDELKNTPPRNAYYNHYQM